MKEKKLNMVKWVIGGFGVLLILALLLSAISLITSYEAQLSAQAGSRSEYLLDKTSILLEEAIESKLSEARIISGGASQCTASDQVSIFLGNSKNEHLLKSRIVKGNKIYTEGYSEYESSSNAAMLELTQGLRDITFLGIYTDYQDIQSRAVVYIPFGNAGLYDGIFLYYTTDYFTSLEIDSEEETASYLAVTKNTDMSQANPVIVLKETELIDEADMYKPITEALSLKITDPAELTQLSALFTYSNVTSVTLHMSSEEYFINYNRVGNSNLYLIGLYSNSVLYTDEYSFYRSITALFILFAALFIGTAVFLVISYFVKRTYNKDESTSVTYRCLTYIGFVNEATSVYSVNSGSKFAVICINIRFYKYLLSLNNGMEKKIVMNLRTLFSKMMRQRECFGYDANGGFYLFLHFDDIDGLLDRMKIVDKICHRIKIDSDKRLTLFYGIAECQPKEDILTTVEHAKEALRGTEQTIGIKNYEIFDSKELEDSLDREFIEMHVESALSKGDFKVFYQPKYNMNKNMIDGAEALVRWYMPEENRFYPPASFLPVIEQNGFIAKVDRYVFEQVCIYIRNCLNNGIRLQPISVNVSQVSLGLEDFIDYYTRVKQQYKIRDGMIYIEFTESAYFENTAAFSDMINKLHAAGFLCSIDDFGTGFSSYNSLKQFNMDEIKLDRFFLKQGLSSDRDHRILKSVISLGKELGMKVTTEGVSSTEEYNLLKELGCDVMQGFLYAKPMPQADFESFITSGAKGSFN